MSDESRAKEIEDLIKYWRFLHSKITSEEIEYQIRENNLNGGLEYKTDPKSAVEMQICAMRQFDMQICIDLSNIYGIKLPSLKDENEVENKYKLIVPEFTLN